MKKLLTVFVFVLLAGCSSNVSLTGRVTFSDNNEPLTEGTVYFTTEQYLAHGVIQPDGTYKIGSLSNNDGIPPNTYQVFITGANRETGKFIEGTAILEPMIDDKFTSASTSGLTFDVSRKNRKFDFTVDRYKKPKGRK